MHNKRNESDCSHFLWNLGISTPLPKAGALLLQPFCMALVREALIRLHNNSVGGVFGFSVEFFKHCCDVFEPQMYVAVKQFLDEGVMPSSWT